MAMLKAMMTAYIVRPNASVLGMPDACAVAARTAVAVTPSSRHGQRRTVKE
jgi:hypothetical protein